MVVKCKCGFAHSDLSSITFKKDDHNRTKAYCQNCGREESIARYSMFIIKGIVNAGMNGRRIKTGVLMQG